MSNSQSLDHRRWKSYPRVAVFLFALASSVAAQPTLLGTSADKLTLLRRAVVIVTTLDAQGKPLLQGSGFFIAADLIVTNMHVIKDAELIRIHRFDGHTCTVQNIIAVDEREDLALLQMDAPFSGATFLQLAGAAPVEGEAIVVMSNPRGTQWKLTQGRVGPIWKFKGTGNRVQITAAILPGSSGGPVVNKNGHVVGVAVMHLDSSTNNLNFAVPVESLKALQASTSIATFRTSGHGN